jgi:hypothetical protein
VATHGGIEDARLEGRDAFIGSVLSRALHAWIDRVQVRLRDLVAMLKAMAIRRVLP